MTDPRTPPTSAAPDGCPEYDERLVDLAAEPIAAPDLEAHLATCERCRVALDQYLDAGRAVAAALTTLGGPDVAETPARARRFEPWALAAAALLVAIAAWGLRDDASPAQTPAPAVQASVVPVGASRASSGTLAVAARYDAIVSLVGPATARIEEGTSTFLIRDGRSVVETPIGDLSCEDCEFTVHVRACADESLPSDLAALAARCVTVSVSQGRLGTTVLDQALTMGPGQTVTWPLTAECVPVAGARIPGLYH